MTDFRRLRSQIVSSVLWVISAEMPRRTKGIPVRRATSVLLALTQASGPVRLAPTAAIGRISKIKANACHVPQATTALQAQPILSLHQLVTISLILALAILVPLQSALLGSTVRELR